MITAIGADIKALQTRDTNYNVSTSTPAAGFAADTYLAGSGLTVPAGKIKAGTIYRCKFNVAKTNAGTQTPIITVRVGTAGTIADTARATLTFLAQTAVVDDGIFEVDCVFRAAGASAIIQALGELRHRLTTTGLSNGGANTTALNTGSSFDVTTATKIGISVNGGTSAAWTITLVSAELLNLTP
jgi:hypothetical protein